ncbi:kinase-like domain-containing protein [Gigaspora rosea]|uniref:Kinase-like domain-containing protein n=1 Tax=Gigaspora rosea TaxID=44941 RepID=A0A397V9V0_9GLOM|nr:kinase-like domain-containing protein [Gigaspora rosea]
MSLSKEAIKNFNLFDYKEFDNIIKIDEGEFGTIYKAYWKDCAMIVAFKLLILQKVCHYPNIIEFFGFTINPSNENIIVLQFAENGNLRDYLQCNFPSLKDADKFRIAREISLGLVFLHKNDVIHQDFNTKNILVHEGKMLIADFGLSINDTNSGSANCEIHGTAAFVEPQALKDSSYKLTKKSDIYGLGVILWEISSGKMPFKNDSTKTIIFNIMKGVREIPVDNIPLRYIELYRRCWHEDPEKRPDALAVLKELDQIRSNH